MSGTDKLTNVANALSQRFMKKLARQFNFMAVTAASIQSEAGFGKNVAWDVEMDGASAGSYAEGADVAGSELNVNTLVPATLSWGHYRAAFQVSETEFDAAATSAGSADAILKLYGERIMGAGAKLASVINIDLISGTGTDGSGNPNAVGLLGGSLDASGTYAGLPRSTYPLWAGNVLSNGGVARALTLDLMSQLESSIFTASGERPTVIWTSPGVFRRYQGLIETIRRVEGTGPMTRYDTSTTELFFQGIPILRDKDIPETGGRGTMIFGNTAHVSKVYLPNSRDAQEDVFKVQEVEGEGSNGETEKNRLALPFKIVPLAKNGDSLKFMIKVVWNLKVDRPNSMGYIQDIAL